MRQPFIASIEQKTFVTYTFVDSVCCLCGYFIEMFECLKIILICRIYDNSFRIEVKNNGNGSIRLAPATTTRKNRIEFPRIDWLNFKC